MKEEIAEVQREDLRKTRNANATRANNARNESLISRSNNVTCVITLLGNSRFEISRAGWN